MFTGKSSGNNLLRRVLCFSQQYICSVLKSKFSQASSCSACCGESFKGQCCAPGKLIFSQALGQNKFMSAENAYY